MFEVSFVICRSLGIGSFHLSCQIYEYRVVCSIPLLSFQELLNTSEASSFISAIDNLGVFFTLVSLAMCPQVQRGQTDQGEDLESNRPLAA